MGSVDRVNVLVKTFSGLSLPSTVSLSLPLSTTTTELLNRLVTILPSSVSSYLTLTTTCNRIVLHSPDPLTSLISPGTTDHVPLLPLHLHCPLPGGKGGFGSQLRAAGGRMSSRKRKNALASDPNGGVGSNRNLDGRRLRTITEAKNLAEYLAIKPEMERREKEERRKRWEAVVEGAERREEEIRRGLGGAGRGKGLSEEWLEEKDDVSERTREAVKKAMLNGGWKDNLAGTASGDRGTDASLGASSSNTSRDPSEEDSDQDDMDLDEEEVKILEKEAADGDVDALWVLRNKVKKPPLKKGEGPKYIGFDEDDEFATSSEDDPHDHSAAKVKGKQKVISLE